MPMAWKLAQGFNPADALKRDTIVFCAARRARRGASGGDIFGQKNADEGL